MFVVSTVFIPNVAESVHSTAESSLATPLTTVLHIQTRWVELMDADDNCSEVDNSCKRISSINFGKVTADTSRWECCYW